MGRSGFNRGNPLVMTAEAVRENRAEAIKVFQDECAHLKKQIGELESRKSNLETEITQMISDRLKPYENKLAELKGYEERLHQQDVDLQKQRATLNGLKASWEAERDSQMNEINTKLQKNELILRDINQKEISMEKSSQDIKDYGLRLAEQEAELQKRRESFEKELQICQQEKKALTVLQTSLQQKENTLRAEIDVLTLNRNSLGFQRQEVERLIIESRQAKDAAEEELAKLEVEKENLLKVARLNENNAEVMKTQQKAMDDKEAELSTWEHSLKARMKNIEKREQHIKIKERGTS